MSFIGGTSSVVVVSSLVSSACCVIEANLRVWPFSITLAENETEVSDIKKTATDNKSKFSEERLNKITDVNKLRRFYKAMLTSTLTELRRVYGRNSSDTELKDLADYYNTLADKVIEKGNTLKLASITQQAEETKEETKEVSPAEEATATEEVPSTEPIDSASEPIDSTPSSSASKTVARKVFSTFDTFMKKLPKLRSLLSTSNFDKETELIELLNQHESAIEEYNRLMTVERKTWEDQLLTQKAKSFKNKNYLEKRIDHYRDTVLDFNRRIRAAQRRLKKLTENGFTDEANTVQIQQLEQTINNLKTNTAYKNALKQVKSLNTRMDKYFLTEKEIADRIKELDKFYGKNILPLERKIQDILTKSDNSISNELLSSTFEILEDGRNIYRILLISMTKLLYLT